MNANGSFFALVLSGLLLASTGAAQRLSYGEVSADRAAASPALSTAARQAMQDRIDAVNASFRAAHGGQAPEQFGLQCCQITQIPSAAFTPINNSDIWSFDSSGYLGSQASDTDFLAPVILPSGVAIVFLDLYYYSFDNAIEAVAQLIQYKGSGGVSGPPSTSAVVTVDTTGHSGNGYLASNPISYTVNNNVGYDPDAAQLMVKVTTTEASGFTSRFKAVDLWWMRQISPPPATATFSDVPLGHPFFQFVEALAGAGITVGYPDGRFGVDDPITRGQMAVFMAKALGLYWPY